MWYIFPFSINTTIFNYPKPYSYTIVQPATNSSSIHLFPPKPSLRSSGHSTSHPPPPSSLCLNSQQLQYNLILKVQPSMSTYQSRTHYDRPTYQNTQPTEAAPLRSKAFSQIDNLPHTNHNNYTHSHSPNSQNLDKIAEIKKKYDKLLIKPAYGQNQAVENSTKEHLRSISGVQNHQWELYKKANGTPQSNFDKNVMNYNQKPTTPIKRQTLSRDYCATKPQERHSVLQENRVALSAMKSELQTRLNQISSKNTMVGGIRQNHQTHQLAGNIAPKTSNYQQYQRSTVPQSIISQKYTQTPNKGNQRQDFSNQYQKILSKYNKNQVSNNLYKQRQRGQNPSKIEDSTKEVSSLSKYMNSKNQNPRQMVNKQQLSVISEHSNSNTSQMFNEKFIQTQNKPRDSQQVKVSYVRQIFDVRNDDIFRKTIDQSLRYKKYKEAEKYKETQKQQPYVQKKYTLNMNNVTSRYTNTSSSKDATPANPSKNNIYLGENQKSKDFNLQKLDNNVGSIKRTATQDHYQYFNKSNMIQNRQTKQDYKQKYANIYPNPTKSKQLNNQSSKYGLHLEVELGEATFGKKNQKDPLPVYQAVPSVSAHQKAGNQIQRLKQRYGKHLTGTNNSNFDDYPISKQETDRQPSKKVGFKDYQLKDNQQISNKIEKLDKKIKQLQNNKKNLNISFQPFQNKVSPKHNYNFQKSAEKYANSNQYSKYQDKYRNVQNKTASNQKQEDKGRTRASSYYQKVKPIYSEVTLPEGTKTYTNGFAIKLLPVQNNQQPRDIQDRTPTDPTSKSQTKQQFLNKMEFELKTDTGIQQRKRKLKQKVQTNNNIKSLVKIIGQQAVFDEMFRNNKIWFASEKSEAKWESLKKELINNHVNLSDGQIKQEFQIAQAQNNPFFSVSDSKCDMKSLVSSYNQARRHWYQKISKKFDRKSLEKQGLTAPKIDCDRKGFILIQDLVRFLNIQSGNFLRNRDLSIIFKRINKRSDKISFEELIEVVSS